MTSIGTRVGGVSGRVRRAPSPPARDRRSTRGPAPRVRGPGLDGWLGALVALVVLAPQLRLADGELMSPDAAGYLDIARRFWGHGSLATGFDFYQFWPGATHPVLPYMQPLYPILLGWTALGGVRGMIAANLVVFAAACGLTTALTARFAGRITAIFAGLLLGFSSNALYTAIHPWTEPLHLLVLLVAIGAFARPSVPRPVVGVILAASALVRFAGIYNAAGLLLAVPLVRGWNAAARKEVLAILAGFLAVAVPYEAFCLLRYGALYPEYLAAAKDWTIATQSGGGSFRRAIPALVVHAPALPSGLLVARGAAHLVEFARALGWGGLLAVAAVAGLFGPRRREPVFAVFVVQGVFAMFAISASFAWLEKIEADRYALVSFFTLVPTGLATLRLAARALLKAHSAAVEWAFGAFLAVAFAWCLMSWTVFMRIYGVGIPPQNESYLAERDRVAAWIDAHAPADVLVATSLLQDPVLTEHSVIALPRGKQLVPPRALEEFLGVWAPRLVVTGNPDLAGALAKVSPYRPAMRTDHIWVLERADAPAR